MNLFRKELEAYLKTQLDKITQNKQKRITTWHQMCQILYLFVTLASLAKKDHSLAISSDQIIQMFAPLTTNILGDPQTVTINVKNALGGFAKHLINKLKYTYYKTKIHFYTIWITFMV